mgnify:CR=1 FL=1
MSKRVPYDDAYATCERTFAELRIYTGDISPDYVTHILGIHPTHIVRVGEIITNSSGRQRVGRVNGWFLSSEGNSNSLDLRRHLDWLLPQLNENISALRQLQDLEEIKMSIVCIWWSKSNTGGPTL